MIRKPEDLPEQIADVPFAERCCRHEQRWQFSDHCALSVERVSRLVLRGPVATHLKPRAVSR